MNLPAILFLVVFTASSNQFINRIRAASSLLCPPCEGPKCDITYEACEYDTYRDFCGQMKCKSGPGKPCGGWFDILGKCAAGLSCNCNLCSGCTSDTVECFENKRCPSGPQARLPALPGLSGLGYPFTVG